MPGEDCRENSQGAPYNTSLSGLEFYPQAGGSFPAAYRGALFFGDRWRDCIWALLPGPDGLPRPGNVVKFAQQADSPIDLEVGPGGDLYYVDSKNQVVKRFRFSPPNDGYPRPTAAGSLRLPLVVAYRRVHLTQPRPRTAARIRLVQPSRTLVVEPHRRDSRCEWRRGEFCSARCTTRCGSATRTRPRTKRT